MQVLYHREIYTIINTMDGIQLAPGLHAEVEDELVGGCH